MPQTQRSCSGKAPPITVVEQFDQALVCIEDLSKTCKGLFTYAKKRFAIEKEYAKSLQKLTRSTLDATLTPKGVAFQGGLGPAWYSVLQSTQECAEMKLSATTNLEHSVLASLNSVFDGELSKSRKDLSAQGHQSSKNLQDVVQLLNKAQSSYVNGAQDWQSCLLTLHRDLGGEWRALDNPKQRDKEAALSRKCEEAKQAYLASIRQANNTQHLHHFDQMPPLLTQLSELSEDIMLVARQSLVHLLEQAELLQRSVAKQLPRVPVAPPLQAVRNLDPKSFTSDFIFCHMTSDMVEPPRPFVFEEFLMEDDAAHLYFQKSRYECLQAFPTTATLENSVIRQIDNDGFFVSSESFSQVAESDRDEMRRRMTTSTDTIPAPNSRSSVTYMLALRKAVIRSTGSSSDTPATAAAPAAYTPAEDASPALSWLPRRRMPSGGSRSVTPKHVRADKERSATPERHEAVREVGRSSWFIPEDCENVAGGGGGGGGGGGAVVTAVAATTGDEQPRFKASILTRRSVSEGDITQPHASDINPYASVDSIAVSRKVKVRPVVPPRPSIVKKKSSDSVGSPSCNVAPTSSPPPPPPPPLLSSVPLGMHTSQSLEGLWEGDDGDDDDNHQGGVAYAATRHDDHQGGVAYAATGDRFPPPPLPGEEDEDVYTLPKATTSAASAAAAAAQHALVGSPGSASFLPSAESSTATAYMAPLPYLVQVCVQYLHSTTALREEGLFRVSGDITRIRQLKAAFDALENNTNSWSSGRSLANFLEEEINKERDPNTVAGLLKMYLREQNYIDAAQCRSLVDSLYPTRTLATLSNSAGEVKVLEMAMREQLPSIEEGDPVKVASIRTIVREEMSPVAQSVLSAMCRLLAKLPSIEEGDPVKVASIRTIVREEMSPVAESVLSAMCRLLAKVAKEGDRNRMNGHSLGMCCGLSVFPAMSTGHASSVLRFMLQNWQTVFAT